MRWKSFRMKGILRGNMSRIALIEVRREKGSEREWKRKRRRDPFYEENISDFTWSRPWETNRRKMPKASFTWAGKISLSLVSNTKSPFFSVLFKRFCWRQEIEGTKLQVPLMSQISKLFMPDHLRRFNED